MKKKLLVICIFCCYFIHSQPPTWSNDVARIFYKNCTNCHRTGGIAPFSLTDYSQVVAMKTEIQTAINNGHMPPWTPDPSYRRYANERIITDSEKNILLNWIQNNTPSGDLRFAPPIPLFTNGTQLDNPELSLTIPSYTVTDNDDVYHNFELPTGLNELNYATAIEIIPGNSSIVHHVLVFEDNSTNPIDPNSVGGTGSPDSKLLLGYAPGSQPVYTPQGTGFKINANTRIILQIHYAPGSLGMTDNTQVNFKLTTSPQREIMVTPALNHNNLTNGPLFIPANQTRTFNAEFQVPADVTILGVFPHMHKIGRTIEVYGTPLVGNNIPFVKINEWDFHWQDNMIFQNAQKVPIGTTLKSTAFYDNTTNNPENPFNPPQDISLGDGTNDEMMLVFFSYLNYQLGDENLIMDTRAKANGATTFCQGNSVQLTAIQGQGYTYQWFKNNTAIANANTYEFIANESGNYHVEITLGTNTSTSQNIEVIVNPVPLANISPSGNISVPQNQTVLLQASTGVGYSYQWYLNDQIINGANLDSYIASQEGEYYVEIFNGCYAISEKAIISHTLSTDNFESENPYIIENPNNGSFTVKNVLNAEINIFNIMGQKVFHLISKETESRIHLNSPSKSIYLLQIKNSKGKISTHKIIIK